MTAACRLAAITSCAPVSTAAFATRRRAVNCAEDCRSALSGARPTAKSASTPTRPWSPPSAMFSRALPRRARRAGSGYGFVPKGSHSLCRCIRAPRSAGSRPATAPSTTFSPIPSMPAPTLMANPVGRRCCDVECIGRPQKARPKTASLRVAGAHSRPSSGLHRLADLRGQPGSHRQKYPPRTAQSGRRREGRQRSAARPCRLRALRTPLANPLSRTPLLARLSLPRQDPGRGPRRLLPQRRRRPDRRGRRAGLHRRPRAGEARRHCRRRGAARGRSRDLAQAMAPRRRAGKLREWEERLSALEAAKAELSRREEARPRALSEDERRRLLALGADLAAVWHAATTTPRDRKELMRTLLEEIIVKVERDKATARLTLRWKGGALAEIDLALPRSRPATIRTDEDTIALVRRLAALYPDAVIAGILNRQGRTTVYGHRFEAGRVGSLRRHWNIPCFEPSAAHAEGEPLTIKKAAAVLAVAPSTLHRLLNAGIIPGEQLTPGAPWRIRLTHDVLARFNNDAGEGFMPMREAVKALGVSRQTVLQRVKRGELDAVHVMRGKQKGLRIKAVTRQPELFDRTT